MTFDPSPAGDPLSKRDPAEQPATPRSAGRNLPVAIVTGVTLATLIFATLFTTRIGWILVVMTAVSIGTFEFYSVVRRKGYEPATWLGIAAGIAMMGVAAWRGPRGLSFVIALFVIASFLWFLIEPGRRSLLGDVSITILGALYTSLMGAHVVMMRDLPAGPAMTISYLGLVAFSDIGAYAAGSFFGKHKIAPSISPGKTWEGALGATLLVFALAAGVGPFLGRWTLGSALVFAAAVAVMAPLGDLAESLLKRDLGVKDFGHILPGHGGLLDRIDALLLTAPVAYWIMRWLTI